MAGLAVLVDHRLQGVFLVSDAVVAKVSRALVCAAMRRRTEMALTGSRPVTSGILRVEPVGPGRRPRAGR